MISEDDKQRACMMLYSALAQDKVDFSTGRVQYQLTPEQRSYLKALLFVFGMPGPARDQGRTGLRDHQLDTAARIEKANSPESTPWRMIEQRIGRRYEIPASRVKKARARMRRFYEASGHPPQIEPGTVTLDDLQLSSVDFKAIFKLFPQLEKS